MRGTVRKEKKVIGKSRKKKREFWSAGEWFLVLLGSDLLAKQYVEETMREGEEREIPGKKLILRKVYNRGISFEYPGRASGHREGSFPCGGSGVPSI